MAQLSFKSLQHAGQVVGCRRCGTACRVAATADTTARPFQHADGNGQCTACIVTDLLKGDLAHALAAMTPGTDIKDVLRAPHIQQAFASMLQVGRSELTAAEIDWELVIANWELPLIKRKRG